MNSQSEGFSLHVRHFAELLITLRAELGKDLDLVLILAVIAERHYARTAQHDKKQPARTSKDTTGTINALSISLYTAIPRETVRRKVKVLVEKGWVECDASGNLSPSKNVKGDLAKGTAATLDYLAKVSDTPPISALLSGELTKALDA